MAIQKEIKKNMVLETIANSFFTSSQKDYIDPEDDTEDNYIDPSEKGPASRTQKLSQLAK